MSEQAAGPEQQVAVITGAGTGIGAAVARRLVAGGAAVVLTGRRPQPLHDLAAELGKRAVAVPPKSLIHCIQRAGAARKSWGAARYRSAPVAIDRVSSPIRPMS